MCVCVCVCVAWFLFVWRIATTRTADTDQRDTAGTSNRHSRGYEDRTAAISLTIARMIVARQIGGAPAVSSTMIMPGSTTIEPNTITLIVPGSTRIVPLPHVTNTILPLRLDNNNDDSNDDRGCCCFRFDVTVSFCVLLLYHAIHCYDITITNKTNKHTCKNNF